MKIIFVYKSRSEENQLEAVEDTSIRCALARSRLRPRCDWHHTNIDEGTMGEMAMNIAFRGEHPVFFYGQDYMGALQAYLAAGFFRLFGVSLFTLRLGLVFLFALFLISMYLMASL